jgi:hypothetical protein
MRAAVCDKNGQKVPQGYRDLGEMLGMVARHSGTVGGMGIEGRQGIDVLSMSQDEAISRQPPKARAGS